MGAQRRTRGVQRAIRQRGQAMMIVAFLVALGIYALIVTTSSSTSVTIAQRQAAITERAFAQAKEALIGYAASDANRPGSLPCPDTDNNGNAQAFSSSDCPGYIAGSNVFVGRLPWQTLGLPDLRDGSGERLWYAVSHTFARNPSCIPSCPPALTSDTLGQLTVTGTAPANDVIAIIFAPGGVVGSQTRDAANENNVTNYLEGENATNDNSTFTTASVSATFNDRLLVITGADLMPAVEQRVAREIMINLQSYRTATGFYPWADIQDGDSNDGQNRGRFPCGGATPYNWGRSSSPVTPPLPGWLTYRCGNDGWASIIYYAAGSSALDSGCTSCTSGYASLKVDSVSGTDLVLITPGAASASPRGTWTNTPGDPITGYFEDFENSNNNNDDYVTPTSTAYNRDRIFKFP